MKVAIHQLNFVPWLPYFYKMAMADTFIFLDHVQFEKSGYQNRFMYKDKWITKPVQQGIDLICEKNYVGLGKESFWGNGGTLSNLNRLWIDAIRHTLNINTIISHDYMNSNKRGTDRLIELIKEVGGTTYITNRDAKDKYLEEDKMMAAGIDIGYCVVPKNLQISIFEAFETFGIEGTIKQLPKRKHAELEAVL